ncbi:hypothetical protein BUALT_Bualt04G0102300 [Buddleja alternifolia]|uniref:X8 domain-containing protein n=1 Tax=Buddleja alternifolia TaxID=168488 RepID=A0AAV6XPT5_9LAMI|nr:hypothetical protein BUALT_Bualt04G0102300 [Buddleja alternifolia]
MNTFWLCSLFSLLFLTVTGQESVEFIHLHDSSENGLSMAIQVQDEHLNNVSKSVVMAETWVKSHVLAFYPATNITTIIVGNTLLCNKNEEQNLGFILPSIKNIYHTLTRWGLQNHIKVSTSFSPNCLDSKYEAYIQPLLNILQEIGSPYVVNTFSDENSKTHFKSMKKIGSFHLKMVEIIEDRKPTSRKLSYIDLSNIIAPSASSQPAFTATSPLPPLIGTFSPPPSPNSFTFPPSISPPFLPHLAPMGSSPVGASPPYGPHLPPCEPPGPSVGAPVGGVHHGVWCVAKPSVPQDTLQEALDYACGDGGADCEAIAADGSCYMPDSLVAHASYAFNSYWQKSKRNGGTCGFGGTAMIVTSDPSYRHCRFVLT